MRSIFILDEWRDHRLNRLNPANSPFRLRLGKPSIPYNEALKEISSPRLEYTQEWKYSLQDLFDRCYTPLRFSFRAYDTRHSIARRPRPTIPNDPSIHASRNTNLFPSAANYDHPYGLRHRYHSRHLSRSILHPS